MATFQKPDLKKGTELNLQNAWEQENWPLVVRIADLKAKKSADTFYEVVKACALGQTENLKDKCAPLECLYRFLENDAPTIKDEEAIEILEWACMGPGLLEDTEYGATIGLLRYNMMKAGSKERALGESSLVSCLLHWDLINAQKIAALLDFTFPNEKSPMLWNVTISHLLSFDEQHSPQQAKVFGTLAMKKLQKAQHLHETALKETTQGKLPARALKTESDVNLLYELVLAHGTEAEFQALLKSPLFSPVAQMQSGGHKTPLLKSLDRLMAKGMHNEAFWMCRMCLQLLDEDGKATLRASDWDVWRRFILTAREARDTVVMVPYNVDGIIKDLLASKDLNQIYRRNLLLARVEATFQLVETDGEDMVGDKPLSQRMHTLLSYIENQETSAYCFSDIKEYVEQLTHKGMKFLAFTFTPNRAQAATENYQAVAVSLLACKLQFLVVTHPHSMHPLPQGEEPWWGCYFCNSMSKFRPCGKCLGRISQNAMRIYKPKKETWRRGRADDVLADLAVLVAMCLIRQGCPEASQNESSPLRLLQALVVLERQVELTPRDSRVLLLLVRLHLVLGSISRALEFWRGCEIKRTIIQSLGPLFYDRLGAVAPALVTDSDKLRRNVMDPVNVHFTAIRSRMQESIRSALTHENSGSLLQILNYNEEMRMSATRAISWAEETRAARAMGLKKVGVSVLDDIRYSQVRDEDELSTPCDYGSFPCWESSMATPIYSLLSLGPKPSNARVHLAMIAEAFHDIMTYKQPTTYKSNIAAGDYYLTESMQQINNSLSRFLQHARPVTTPHEFTYYQLLHILTALIPLVESSRAVGKDVYEPLNHMTAGCLTALELLCLPKSLSPDLAPIPAVLSICTNLVPLSYLRDGASSIRLVTAHLLVFHERECKEGKGLDKLVLTHVQTLDENATTVLTQMKQQVIDKCVKHLIGYEAEQKVREWIQEDGAIKDEGVKETMRVMGIGAPAAVSMLIKSWRASIKGWQIARWE